ncbi:phosphodiesterase [Geodermatophilus sp. URMC 64]
MAEQTRGGLSPARAAGRLAGVPLGALARWRQGKPMHPRGAVFGGQLERGTGGEPVGVPWLDEPGQDAVVVRLSRGIGLPEPWPDLLGLAVRIPAGADGEPVDLLLTSTATAPLLRMVPVPRLRPATPYTSIMGYRSDAGTLLLAALPDRGREPLRFTLCAAQGQGPWRPFGRLTLTGTREPLDPDVRFDAVRHPPHGLVPDGPMARFRAPAYAAAREGRDQPPP